MNNTFDKIIYDMNELLELSDDEIYAYMWSETIDEILINFNEEELVYGEQQ